MKGGYKCMEDILWEFELWVGKFKRAYAEEYGLNPNYLEIHIDADNYCTVVEADKTGMLNWCTRYSLDVSE